MNKCSREFLSLPDDCLRQFAQTESNELSSVLTSNDLTPFQASDSEGGHESDTLIAYTHSTDRLYWYPARCSYGSH